MLYDIHMIYFIQSIGYLRTLKQLLLYIYSVKIHCIEIYIMYFISLIYDIIHMYTKEGSRIKQFGGITLKQYLI